MMNAVAENRLLSRWAELLPQAGCSVGRIHESDAELIPLGDRLLALTVDTVAEEVRVGLYRDPATAGRIATVAALSDLAAVGADPLGLLLSVTLPESAVETTQAAVAAGVAESCAAAGVAVLGGDTNVGPNLEITATAVGTVPPDRALLRTGAEPGQRVYATGPLGTGGALAAARLLGMHAVPFTEDDYRPRARLGEGRALRAVATSCMDTSDGLVATLDQLARLNQLTIRLTRPLPELLHPRVERIRAAASLPAFPFLACHHGEFELVFTVPDANLHRLDALPFEPVLIGRTEPGQGLFVGEHEIDGARIRNLADQAGADPAAYLSKLLSIAPREASCLATS